MNIKQKVKGLFKWFSSSKRFDRIVIKRAVVEDILGFAKSTYPKEFIALLEGKIQDRVLFITGLLYQTSFTSNNSALIRLNLPLLSGCIGSVHSHPSPSNTPSRADLAFFSKKGPVHFIISAPFTVETMACYSYEGKVGFEIQ